MRYLIAVVLLCSVAGFSQAQALKQLPPSATAVQIQGNTYYKFGDSYYRFNQDGGYYVEVPPPSLMPHDQSAHMYQRGQTVPGTSLTSDQIQGCRNLAADKSNAVPNRGSEVYLEAYQSCINDLQR